MKQGWEIKKLGEVCSFCSGYTPKESELLECGTIPYFKVSDMNHCDNLKYLTHTSLFLEDGCKVYPKHTIVFPKNGAAISTNKKRILAQDSVVDLNTGGVVANDALVYFEYLYLYFLNLDFRLHTRRGAVPTLDIAELKNKSVPVPPREEQERIVEELDCLSGVIEKKREQLKEFDALAQSIFYQMFGDPNTNDRNWNVVKLNTTCDNLDYQRRPITAKDRIEGDIPYYGASGVVDYVQDYIFDGNYLLVSEDGANLEVRHTPIAFSIKGKTWVNNHANILKFEHYCTQLFMEYYINLLDISDIITGCAQPKLTQANLNSIDVFDISIEKQQEFADKIEAIEKQKELIKKSISETETLFNARMDYYFN